MSCGLIDIACHAQNAAWEWWAGVGFVNKALIVLGLTAIILGALRGFLAVVHKLGGWPAVAGVALAVFGLVLAILPRKLPRKPPRRDDDLWINGEPGERPVKRYRVPPRRTPTPPESLTR